MKNFIYIWLFSINHKDIGLLYILFASFTKKMLLLIKLIIRKLNYNIKENQIINNFNLFIKEINFNTKINR